MIVKGNKHKFIHYVPHNAQQKEIENSLQPCAKGRTTFRDIVVQNGRYVCKKRDRVFVDVPHEHS